MKILRVISSLDPRGGGPAEALRASSDALGALGHVVEILCLDDPSATHPAGAGRTVHGLGPTPGRYGYHSALVPWLRTHAHQYDVVLVEGLWQYPGFAVWRALAGTGTPYCVYTHGMLDPWFKRQYPLKHLKKWLYWPWAEYRVLRDAAAVIFTCEEERRLARESFWLYRAREQVLPFGTNPPPNDRERLRAVFLEAHPARRGQRLWLFLGRLHEKKACDVTIAAFARVAALAPDVHLVMAGPAEPGLLTRLQTLAATLGIADRVSWPGMLQGDLKWGAFHASEAFVLSSHQENFGIAVAEALGCGVPVLISDRVNIWREIEADGAGLIATDTVEATEDQFRRWLVLDGEERAATGARARASFDRRFRIDAATQALVALLDRVVSASARRPESG